MHTNTLDTRVRTAEKSSNKWHTMHNKVKKECDESREVIVLYEGLINKLTEQNQKLKQIAKQRKSRKNSNKDGAKVVMHKQTSIFDVPVMSTQSARSDPRNTQRDSKESCSPRYNSSSVGRPKSSMVAMSKSTNGDFPFLNSKHSRQPSSALSKSYMSQPKSAHRRNT